MSAGTGLDRPVRTVLVGYGWAGRTIWLPRLQEHSGYEVTAVVEPDPRARATVPGARGLADVAEVDPAETDLAIVAVPNHLHAPVAERLLLRGVPVFVEKPVCLSVAEADRLAAAELAGGAVLLAGSAARYRADVRALHEEAARLGPVRHLDLAWVRARGVPGAGGWFTDRGRAGGGALVDLGWHLLDAAGPLLDDAEFAQVAGAVSADFVNSGDRRASWHAGGADGAAGDVEDTARGFLVTAGGVSVSLRASWASHEARDVTRLTVEGEAGTAALTCTFGFSTNRWPGPALTRTRHGVTAAVPLPDEPVGAEYLRQLDRLPGRLADPASRGRAIGRARRTIATIERLYASALPGRGTAAPLPEAVHAG
ncbi:Gfo/Idh/MocA family protein [Actinomadura macrotermitis]|uniref:Putative UDP-kanosamine synthase oxidoreductase subunit n=1 Tax=Actinomadura macrotermitis TaxID=2585200 RepID=A0A7K0BYN0_9ACTN|nr:putative UDP-kanosamine synthase oxidoreductase subunit [Actinomadura macrotermitis]